MTFLKSLCIIALVPINRALYSIKQLLLWVDAGVGILLCLPFYIILGHPEPNADETISSVVGWYSAMGYRWAKVAEWFIDRIFWPFEGFKLGHCRRVMMKDEINWEEAA